MGSGVPDGSPSRSRELWSSCGTLFLIMFVRSVKDSPCFVSAKFNLKKSISKFKSVTNFKSIPNNLILPNVKLKIPTKVEEILKLNKIRFEIPEFE